ncbi:ras-related protein RABC2a-like [Musa acuminata AAA Group]|uniref:ras-related protein RABC2a n=1 Tax=Musa acuminata AAA Group TaxID=214697 RepID=UPI0031E2E7A1
MGSSAEQDYDYAFKILLLGDAGVGKSCLIQSFMSHFVDNHPPTLGTDFQIKYLTVGDKKLKLTIWDTAGNERFRTLSTSFYRGAHGIIMVYDMTRPETFTHLTDTWTKEVEQYSTNQDCIKILAGNKLDKESERKVTKEEASALANAKGYLFVECSAKTRQNVEKCFQDLAEKILQVPNLAENAKNTSKPKPKPTQTATPKPDGCCTIQ